ncbi:hypothetical protein DRN70_02245 [Methanosarcinales archaeon]|nr:MAG: hypothetical protein DRN70_02245 [Methanosarcinales archaeon]
MRVVKKVFWLMTSLLLIVVFLSHAAFAQEKPPSILNITIPNYEVITEDGEDYVEIPDGDILTVVGRPLVPYYSVLVNYPKGYIVQNVILINKAGLSETSGLKIPNYRLEHIDEKEEPPQVSRGWFPDLEREFEWKLLEENPDGSIPLRIDIFPFYYNNETTQVKFYKEYTFRVEYILSTVEITKLSLDKYRYQPGDSVHLNLELKNSGDSKDVVLSVVVRDEGTDEIVAGLPVRTLKNLAGEASLTAEWDSSGITEGYYYAEVTLADSAGNTLDRKTVGFATQVSEAPAKPMPEKPAATPEKTLPTPVKPTEIPILLIIGVVIVAIVLITTLVIRIRRK